MLIFNDDSDDVDIQPPPIDTDSPPILLGGDQ